MDHVKYLLNNDKLYEFTILIHDLNNEKTQSDLLNNIFKFYDEIYKTDFNEYGYYDDDTFYYIDLDIIYRIMNNDNYDSFCKFIDHYNNINSDYYIKIIIDKIFYKINSIESNLKNLHKYISYIINTLQDNKNDFIDDVDDVLITIINNDYYDIYNILINKFNIDIDKCDYSLLFKNNLKFFAYINEKYQLNLFNHNKRFEHSIEYDNIELFKYFIETNNEINDYYNLFKLTVINAIIVSFENQIYTYPYKIINYLLNNYVDLRSSDKSVTDINISDQYLQEFLIHATNIEILERL